MNSIVTCCALLTATLMVLASVAAYDFKDAAFNQVLARDLEDLYTSWDQPRSNVRNRRETDSIEDDEEDGDKKCGPPHHGPHGHGVTPCCGQSIIDAIRKAGHENMKACFKEVIEKDKDAEGGPEGRPDPFDCERHKKHIMCVAECESRKVNLLDDKGNHKEQETTNFIKDLFKDTPWFESIQDQVISTCLNIAKNASANHSEETCNPAAVAMKHCLFRQIQLGCPDDEIKDKESCSKLREKLKKQVEA